MPIEIRELVIRTEVKSQKDSQDSRLLEERLAEMKRKITRECLQRLTRLARDFRKRR